MKLARVLAVMLVLSLYVAVPAEAREAHHAVAHAGPAVTRAKATVLLGIEVERGSGETKVHLKTNGPIKGYREVRLKKNIAAHRPDRMYLDLKKVRLAGPFPAKQVGTALAKIRTGRRVSGVRVVFDSNLDKLFHYQISKEPDGLLVTIREPANSKEVVVTPRPGRGTGAGPERVVAPAVVTIQPQPKAAGDLGLLIVTADNPDQTQDWLDSPPDRKGGLKILKRAKPNQLIRTSFLVTGVASDRNGDYSVAVSFALLDPHGKPVLSERRFATASGRAPATPAFFLAEPELAVTLSKSDPAGEYTISASVEDLIDNKAVGNNTGIRFEK